MPNKHSTEDIRCEKRIIYYDHIADIWAFQPDNLECVLEFDSYAQLIFHCIQAYGEDIEFHEVTEQNWQQLYDSGAFDR